MKTTLKLCTAGLAVLLLTCSLHAGQSQSSGGKNSTTTGGSTSGAGNEPFQQTIAFNPANSVGIGFNGTNPSTHGIDYVLPTEQEIASGDLDAKLKYSYKIPAEVQALYPTTEGYSYTNVTYGGSQQYVKQTLTTTDPVTGEVKTKETGVFKVLPNPDRLNTNEWVEVKPGAVMDKVTVGMITGTSSTEPVGMLVNKQHNDNQLIGGVFNGLNPDFAALEGLINSVKSSATSFMDLSTGQITGGLGTRDKPAIVYAKGKQNADGTVSESDVHWSGQQRGYGIIVIEIDDPNKAQFVMSGQSLWTGLVVVVTNKVPTSNKQPLAFVGGGQNVHILGGVIAYTRNIKRSPTDTATILGQEMVKLAGNGNVRYSNQALNFFNDVAPTTMQVRSWRRLAENE
ncbi:MAG TPA: hypothetical protein VEK08_00285 [Planctomycetota bacterium]|nr:hypothetical protein [Planctomycetota bacterium]